MDRIRFICFIAGAFAVTSLFANTSAMSFSCSDVRGTIVRLTKADGQKNVLGRVLIEGTQESNTQVDKASVTVTTQTRLFRKEGEELEPAAFADLKEGQRVEACFAGPVLESYPVQATAAEIIIL